MGNLRILLIEDSASMRQRLVQLLRPLRADIEEASNGYDGLKIAQSYHLDLIITDLDMPGMDGLELCQLLQRDPNSYDGNRLSGDLAYARAVQKFRENRKEESEQLLQQVWDFEFFGDFLNLLSYPEQFLVLQ